MKQETKFAFDRNDKEEENGDLDIALIWNLVSFMILS